MFSIGDLKAPGPDELHALFYEKFWYLIGEEITTKVLHSVNNGHIPDNCNETTVVLIPKIDTPELVTHFRPISPCNGI